MRLRKTIITVTAVGEDGSAVGEAVSFHPINGNVIRIWLRRGADPVATTDVDITGNDSDDPVPVLSVANLAADTLYIPRTPVHSSEDGSEIVGSVDRVPVEDKLKLSVSGANDGSVITAVITWEQFPEN